MIGRDFDVITLIFKRTIKWVVIEEIPTVLNDSTVTLDNDIKARLASNYRDNYTFIFRPAYHLEEDLGP